jgi:hypothetical protein
MNNWNSPKQIELSSLGRYMRIGLSRIHPQFLKWGLCACRVLCASAMTGPEDYATLRLRLSPIRYVEHVGRMQSWSECNVENYDETECGTRFVFDPKRLPEMCKKWFGRGDTGTGDIIQLTVTTTYEILQRYPNDWENRVLQCNVGHAEWSVAAIILGMNQMHVEIVEMLDEAGMFDTPLRYWTKGIQYWMNALRRVCAVWGYDAAACADWMRLRKCVSCSSRVRGEADWPKEYRRRVSEQLVNVGLGKDGMISVTRWERQWQSRCQEFANEVIKTMNATVQLEEWDDWMAARWAHAPSGSSSMRQAVDGVKRHDQRLGSAARPGKKSVMEAVPRWIFMFIMFCLYPMGYIRRSTKEELAEKLRALYALCDIASMVASFASVHMEKHMNVWGVRAKQQPADIVQWVTASVYDSGAKVWLSIDFADWNWQCQMSKLVGWNVALAIAWVRHYDRDRRVAVQKAAAAIWVAASHLNLFVPADSKEERNIKITGSVCSGHRDTSRDNCALHGINVKVVEDMARIFDDQGGPEFVVITGDDEDEKFCDTVAAMNFLMVTYICGFDLNAVKQLGGFKTHEFLQRMAGQEDLPTMPMWPALGQLASGNWYKDVHIYYDSCVSSVSDNCFELFRRGMTIGNARRLAVSTLNAMMRIPEEDEGKYKKLEWWKYRHGQTGHPLWYGTGGTHVAGPLTPSVCRPRIPVRLCRATKDWILSRQRRSNLKLERLQMRKLFNSCIEKSYSTLYAKQRAEKQRELAYCKWPERSTFVDFSNIDKDHNTWVDSRRLMIRMPQSDTDRRPMTYDEMLSRLGLDAEFVEAAGGFAKVYKQLSYGQQAQYEEPIVERKLPVIYAKIDQAIGSWLKNALGIRLDDGSLVHPNRRKKRATMLAEELALMSKGGAKPYVISLFIAPNAGGKTTWVEKDVGRWDMDMIVHDSGYKDRLKKVSKNRMNARDYALQKYIDQFIRLRSPESVTTQWSAEAWILPAPLRQWKMEISIVDVDPKILERRMRERGWPEEKIIRRLNRWSEVKKSYYEIGKDVLDIKERTTIRLLKEWPD